MMKNMVCLLGMVTWLMPLFSQVNYVNPNPAPVKQPIENPFEKGLVFKFSDDGKYSVKLGASAEIWARYAQLNPGTKDADGNNLQYDMDFVLRRMLSSMSVKMDRFMFFSMMGLGTQTYASSSSPYTTAKPSFFFYDAWCQYSVIPDALKIGYGLNLYRGLSRYTSATATRTIGSDVPMLSAPDVVTTDQIARHLGFFAAGNLSRINYRINIGKPFIVDNSNRTAYGVNKAADVPNSHLSFEGYFAYQFLDKEVSALPFTTATYLGQRKLFNIGVGFISHPNSTKSINSSGDTVTYNKLHLALDVFLDLPMRNGGALTCYWAFYRYNYGSNYLLNSGTANVYAKTGGISEPGLGTGEALALQLAWLFPGEVGKTGKLQIYYEGDYRFYEALDDAALHHNFGITYFELGHNLKFTMQYEMRPYFKQTSFDSYKGMVVLKSQFYI